MWEALFPNPITELDIVFLINLEFTNEFQSKCDNQNFEYNYKKNDLKQYAEEYVRSKANLRKC